MYLVFFILVLVSLWLSLYDLRYKEIPDRLWLIGTVFATAGIVLHGFYNTAIMWAGSFVFGWLLYTFKVWEGGDAKVFIVYSMLFPLANTGLWVVNLAFIGFLYSIIHMIRRIKVVPFVPAISLAAISTYLVIDTTRIISLVLIPLLS